MNFRMKNWGVKREKRIIFFGALNIKDGNAFYTDIYIYINIYIYIYIYITMNSLKTTPAFVAKLVAAVSL